MGRGWLYRSSLPRISHGLHLLTEGAAPTFEERAEALARALPNTWLSHSTAARVYRVPLPRRLLEDEQIHLSQPRGSDQRIRRSGVVGHRTLAGEDDLWSWAGVRVTSPARTWGEVAHSSSIADLVCFGDQLVRVPYARYEQRTDAYTTPAELEAVLTRAGRVRGKTKAREALRLVRVGADSVQETLLRLACVEKGLSEPELQVRLHPDDERSPASDMGYRRFRIAIQYDGVTHFTPDQARKDQRRDNRFTAEGWALLRFNADDAREGFQSAVGQIRQALHQAGAV